jgi:hypothetical protein
MLTLHKGSPAKGVARSAWSLAGQYYTAAKRTKTGHSEIPYGVRQPASKDHWLMAVSHAAARRRSPSWMHESVPVRDDARHEPKGIPLLETDP